MEVKYKVIKTMPISADESFFSEENHIALKEHMKFIADHVAKINSSQKRIEYLIMINQYIANKLIGNPAMGEEGNPVIVDSETILERDIT